jgi:hypothetical protein
VSLEAGIALGALFVTIVGGLLAWVWKLRGAIDTAGNPGRATTIPPVALPCAECKAALEACKTILSELKPKIEDTHKKTEELAKWQVPNLEKAIGQLAKASEKLSDAVDKLERRARE